MTNEEIKSHLLHIQSRINMTFRTIQEQEEYEALEMAIKALEQNESAAEWYKLFVKKLDEQEPCTDAVSIDAVIEWLKDKDIIKLKSQEDNARKELKSLPSVKPQPCDDAISRDMALEKMADYVASGYADSAEDFEEYSRIICQLPSVTQKSGNPQPSEHFIDGVRAMGYREGYKDAQKQKSGK